MLAALDVDYRTDGTARAAAVLFHAHDLVQRVENVEPYEPGAFYKRELPCLLAVLTEAAKLGPLVTVVIDGYVTLDAAGRWGLGRYVFGALGERIPVIGVAKTAFEGATHALPLLLGESCAPLLVTAAGLDAQEALARIRQMHGPYRVPALLKRVDRLCRGAE